MNKILLTFLIVLLSSEVMAETSIEAPKVVLEHNKVKLKIKSDDSTLQSYSLANGKNIDLKSLGSEKGKSVFETKEILSSLISDDFLKISLSSGEVFKKEIKVLPGWIALLPPLLAVLIALTTKQVLLALFIGVASGVFFVKDMSFLDAFLAVVDEYLVGALANSDHASIIIFCLCLGGVSGIVTQSGGGAGLSGLFTDRVKSRKGGVLATWFLGLMIFLDDYANTLLVGSSMRPITDKLKMSREKLAFLVDATAAPVASIALISSWVGVEVAYIHEQLNVLGIERDAYHMFLDSLAYRFYPILMLVFIFILGITGKDMFSMLKAEKRAFLKGQLIAPGSQPSANFSDASSGKKANIWNAVIPILVIMITAGVGLYYDGIKSLENPNASIREIFSAANSYNALLWASMVGTIVAIFTTVINRTFKVNEAIDSWVEGAQSMVLAIGILLLAWSLGAVCVELNTASYVISILGNGVSPHLFPTLVFLVSAFVSFASGTSWGTMAIMFPLVCPIAFEISDGNYYVLLGAISSILSGSVWGDHCSPISDTTVMSSMASGCDHIDHAKTQIPYACLVAAVSVFLGQLPVAYELYPAWLGLIFGSMTLFLIVHFFGENVEDMK